MRKTQIAAIACSMLVLAMAFAPVVVLDEDDESEGVTPMGGFIVGFVLGFAIGALFTHYVIDAPSDGPDYAAMNDELKKAFRDAEKDKVSLALSSSLGLANSIMPSDADMIFFTQNYWDQAMEYQVYSTWTKSEIGNYDKHCKEMLAGTGFLAAENNYLTAWSNGLGRVVSNILSQSSSWSENSGKYYDDLSISVEFDGKTITATNGSTTDKLTFSLAQNISTTKDTVVYIDVLDEINNYESENTGTIYLYDTNESKIIQNVETGDYYTLNVGTNDPSNLPGNKKLPAGMYTLPAGASYAGPILSIIGESSAHVDGAVVLKKGSEFYVVTDGQDSSYNVRTSSGTSMTTSKFNIIVDDCVEKKIVSLSDKDWRVVEYWNEIVQSFNKIADNVYETGEATWTIFDVTEESSPYIHPSSLPVNIKDQNLSSVEKYFFTMNMMAEIKDYYEKHEGDLKDFEFTTSIESLDLYCYGNLYLNGNLWMENIVFTPYITTTDQHLSVGMNTWNAPGFLAVWAKVDDYSQWDGNVTITSPMSPIDANYSLEIKKIVKGGEEVQSIDLERQTIRINSPEIPEPPEPTEIPEVYNAAYLWAIILVEAGIILVLVGRLTGITVLSMAGVVVLLVGIIIPQAVSSLILGTFTWSDLKPFGWL